MTGRSVSDDPYLSFKFRVEINGVQVGGFSEVTGLQVEIEVHDFREGGMNEYVHRLAGPAKYPSHLILKRGLMDSTALWDWQRSIVEGNVIRKGGSIILMDASGQEQWRWNFEGAYPVRWSGPDFRAGTAEVAIETIELVHRGLSTKRI